MSEKIFALLASTALFTMCFLLLMNYGSEEQQSESAVSTTPSIERTNVNTQLIREKASEFHNMESDLTRLNENNLPISKAIYNKIEDLGYPITNLDQSSLEISDKTQLLDTYTNALRKGIIDENERAITQKLATQNAEAVAKITNIKEEIESIHTQAQAEYLSKFRNYFELIKRDDSDLQLYESRLFIDRDLYIKVTGSPPKSENIDLTAYKAQRIREINQQAGVEVNKFWNTLYSSRKFSRTPPSPPSSQAGQVSVGAQADYEDRKRFWDSQKAKYDREANATSDSYKQRETARLEAELNQKRQDATSKDLKNLTEAEWNTFLQKMNGIKLNTWNLSLFKNGTRRKIILKLSHSSS